MSTRSMIAAVLTATGLAAAAFWIAFAGPSPTGEDVPQSPRGAESNAEEDEARRDESRQATVPARQQPVPAQAPAGEASPDQAQDEPAGTGADGADGADGAADAGAKTYERVLDYGAMPAIDPQAHPQAASVAKALATGAHPERVSPLVMPEAFSAEAYWADPEAYLSVSEPGRVWQPKQPGDDVPPLRRAGPRSHLIEQGESAELAVQTVPAGCVSFTTFDGGRFAANTLPAITVQADAQGLARVTYEATGGVTDGVSILCASPFCSGTLRFSIFVERPGLDSPFAASER